MKPVTSSVAEGVRVTRTKDIDLRNVTPAAIGRQSRYLGLLVRRSGWFLSLRGWIALIVLVGGLSAALFLGVHPFLAVTERTETPYLVVEGWVPNYALKESIAEFRSKPYREMFTVGGDILNGVNVDPGDNDAAYAVKRLAWLGMNPSLVQPVPSGAHFRDRTYSSALALKQWLDHNEPGVSSFNLVTVGVHARRSRLLFQEAFGDKVRVGIIAVEDREYDPKRWWQYSEGVKEVLSEGAGYLYARFFFHPSGRFEDRRGEVRHGESVLWRIEDGRGKIGVGMEAGRGEPEDGS